MAYTIAKELVAEAFSHSERLHKVIYSVHIFLHCVAVYIEQGDGEKDRHSTRLNPGYKQLLEYVQERFHGWLRRIPNWCNLNDSLKVFYIFVKDKVTKKSINVVSYV